MQPIYFIFTLIQYLGVLNESGNYSKLVVNNRRMLFLKTIVYL